MSQLVGEQLQHLCHWIQTLSQRWSHLGRDRNGGRWSPKPHRETPKRRKQQSGVKSHIRQWQHRISTLPARCVFARPCCFGSGPFQCAVVRINTWQNEYVRPHNIYIYICASMTALQQARTMVSAPEPAPEPALEPASVRMLA